MNSSNICLKVEFLNSNITQGEIFKLSFLLQSIIIEALHERVFILLKWFKILCSFISSLKLEEDSFSKFTLKAKFLWSNWFLKSRKFDPNLTLSILSELIQVKGGEGGPKACYQVFPSSCWSMPSTSPEIYLSALYDSLGGTRTSVKVSGPASKARVELCSWLLPQATFLVALVRYLRCWPKD